MSSAGAVRAETGTTRTEAPGTGGRGGSGAHAATPAEAPAPGFSPRRRLFGRQPERGVGAVTREVAQDVSALVRAEIDLAKTELQVAGKAKGLGIGLLVGAGVFAWLGLQALLITLGFVLALFVWDWLAALIVTLLLLLLAGVLALVARSKLAKPMDLGTTRKNVQEDVTWAKAHLPSRS